MVIVLLILSLIVTTAAIGITSYATYITSKVSGENLLTLNSELGYKYATTYHDWQFAATIAVIAAVVVWVIFILAVIGKHKRRKKKQEMKEVESKVTGNVQ